MKRYIFFLLIVFFSLTFTVKGLNKSVIDITDMTMSEEIDYLNKGIITSSELVSLYLDRIDTYNSDFKAIITVNPNIMDEARKMDELRQQGVILGRLHGIPILVKDNIDVVGMPTTAGAKALADNYPKEDAFVIKKLKEEGAIIIGKANMSEFAFSARDSNSSYGYVSNAFRKGYTSYGSSGGSAVGVALNFASVALGTDTNSSVRLPAAAAGLVGLRPTYGKLSSEGVIAYDVQRDTVGIISKSVLDNAIIMEVLSDEEYDLNIDDKIRIGIPKEFYDGSNKSSIPANKKIFEPIKELLDEEIIRLEQDGIEIVFIEDYYGSDEAYYNSGSVSGFTMCRAFNEYVKGTDGKIRNFSQLTKSSGKISSLKGYNNSCNYKQKDIDKGNKYKNIFRKYVDSVFEKDDLDYIMYPSTKNELYKKGSNSELLNVSKTVSSTIGYPSIVVPLGYYDGMPYGLELMGRKDEEEKLYKIALLIENHNNLINSYETDTEKLYVVPSKVKELVGLFLDNYENKEKKEWIDEVLEYFANYNLLGDEDEAQRLIDEFDQVSQVKMIEDKKDDVHQAVYGMSLFILMILPNTISYISRRKRVNNILYYDDV